MSESLDVKIARIDENVKTLLKGHRVVVEKVQLLDKASEINRRDHRLALWLLISFAGLGLAWLKKQLGV